MSTKEYHGSCHCGKVRFKVQLDLSKGTGRCNCTLCTKLRYWGTNVKPEAFQLISGKEALSDYTKAKPLTFQPDEKLGVYESHNLFCKHCGIRTFGMGNVPEIGGEYVSINVASLDDMDFKEAMAAPLQYYDGRHDKWENTPEFTAHL
jgi:hypothetical protein